MTSVLCLARWSQTQEPAAICSGIEVAADCTVTINRKFMVLEHLGVPPEGAPAGKRFTIAIGPPLGSYYHKHIVGDSQMPANVEPVGGGFVEFKGRREKGQAVWSAKFHQSSGDYGVYTPDILSPERRQAIADALQMEVAFEWRMDYVKPKK